MKNHMSVITLENIDLNDLAIEIVGMAESAENTTNVFTTETQFIKKALCQNDTGPCVCGRSKGRARLCSECFAQAPDFVREQFLAGSPAQRQNAARWLSARAAKILDLQTA